MLRNLENSEKQFKKSVSTEEWMEKNNSMKISKLDLNKLIMNFFLIEGNYIYLSAVNYI